MHIPPKDIAMEHFVTAELHTQRAGQTDTCLFDRGANGVICGDDVRVIYP